MTHHARLLAPLFAHDGHTEREAMSRTTAPRPIAQVKALHLLIEELKKGEVRRDDARSLLRVPHADIGAYFAKLARDKIAEVARREFADKPTVADKSHSRVRGDRGSKPVYRLVADSEKIERFLAGLGWPVQELEDKPVRKAVKIMSEYEKIISMNSGKEITQITVSSWPRIELPQQTWFSGLFYAA